MVFHPGIQQVDVKGAGFELPGANASRQGVVARDPFGVVLSLGVHEQVALLGRGKEVHQGVGRQQVELDGVVVQRHDVVEQLILGLAGEAAEQGRSRWRWRLPG